MKTNGNGNNSIFAQLYNQLEDIKECLSTDKREKEVLFLIYWKGGYAEINHIIPASDGSIRCEGNEFYGNFTNVLGTAVIKDGISYHICGCGAGPYGVYFQLKKGES